MKLLKNQALPEKTSFILIGNINDFSIFNFSKNEEQYIRESLAKRQPLIAVNQFERWILTAAFENREAKTATFENARREATKFLSFILSHKIDKICVVDLDNQQDKVLSFLEGLISASYQFVKYFKNSSEQQSCLREIQIFSPNISENSLSELEILMETVYKVRDLINEPPTRMKVSHLTESFKNWGNEAGFSVKILDKSQIIAEKMGGLLAVNQGSFDEPAFVVMEYKPENCKNSQPIVLVGKGIVFDAGGLSLKETKNSMDYMKSDMSGAATVAGILFALAKNKIPLNVVALVPATDNKPSATAYMPGDIIEMRNGLFVEVLNCDAEGRLILADALSYAKDFSPLLVVDIATLTGAVINALGTFASAMFSNADKNLIQNLRESSEKTYERFVEFPLWEEYEKMLKSDVADMKNIGDGRAGMFAGAKFLERFVSYPWIHLDIAGTAFLHSQENYLPKGATAYGVRLLYHFLKTFLN